MEHTKDSDCTLDDTCMCIVCGVYHGDPCPKCGGRGFHKPGCGLSEVPREIRMKRHIATLRRAKKSFECAESGNQILPGTFYYSFQQNHGIDPYPDRILPEYIYRHFDRYDDDGMRQRCGVRDGQ